MKARLLKSLSLRMTTNGGWLHGDSCVGLRLPRLLPGSRARRAPQRTRRTRVLLVGLRTVSDVEAQAAKDTLDAAIRDYFNTTSPGELVTGWVLVTHRVSDALDEDGSSVVGRTHPTGQRWHVTRGLLDVALTAERAEQTS